MSQRPGISIQVQHGRSGARSRRRLSPSCATSADFMPAAVLASFYGELPSRCAWCDRVRIYLLASDRPMWIPESMVFVRLPPSDSWSHGICETCMEREFTAADRRPAA